MRSQPAHQSLIIDVLEFRLHLWGIKMQDSMALQLEDTNDPGQTPMAYLKIQHVARGDIYDR
jgi:hypothetical protein